jgi:hypothetical protein
MDPQDSIPRESISITAYAAELARLGEPVLAGSDGTLWVRHDAGAMMRVPRFHIDPPAAREVADVLWRGRVAAAQYLLPPNAQHSANAYLYLCTDPSYELEKLSPPMRRNVRRGLRHLRIEALTGNDLLTAGQQAFFDTRRRIGLSDWTPEEFRRRFGWRSRCAGHSFLGAWRGNQLAAFLSTIEIDDWIEIESCYSMNALLPFRPNDTLMYSALFHYLRERRRRVVCYGLSSIQAENNADGLYAFKLKVGFEAQPVHRAFVLHPLLRPLANRVTLRGMNAALWFWPRGRVLKKAEGMLAYILGEARLPVVRPGGSLRTHRGGAEAAK